jgi:uncharacterized oxidoreductase
MQITGNSVVITGGTSGIGFELAKAFVSYGNEVLVCGRNADRLVAAKARLPQLRTVVCDVATEAGRAALLAAAGECQREVNILVNNAGIMLALNFTQPTPQTASQIRDEVEIDLVAPILLSLDFVPLLERQSEAAIVNIGSILAYVPYAASPVYSAAKAGIHSFSASLRHQLRGTSVRVFEISPQAVDTPLMSGFNFPTMPPQRVAAEILSGLRVNRSETLIGQTKIVSLLSRLAPHLAYTLVNRTV